MRFLTLWRRFLRGVDFAWALSFRPFESRESGIPYRFRCHRYLDPWTTFRMGWRMFDG